MLVMIDNYDSFTWNLVQYFGELGEEVRVFRNDRVTPAEIEALAPDRLVISPGPCTPNEAGISLDAFVDKTLRLLELERVAETEQSESILRGMRPETAQRRGRALLGLKCADLRGGLLGKTVLTLELSKRPGVDPPPLPQNKLTPHDVVAIRPSKGDASGDPLCSGVVYRVRDTAIEVALDDPPDATPGRDYAAGLSWDVIGPRLHARLAGASPGA